MKLVTDELEHHEESREPVREDALTAQDIRFDLPGPDTSSIVLSDEYVDRIIGQEKAVELVKLAARQRRFLLLVGEPGTGKSLLGRAVAHLMTPDARNNPPLDLLAEENAADPARPRIRAIAAGEAQALVKQAKTNTLRARSSESFVFYTAALASAFLGFFFFLREGRAFEYLLMGTLAAGALLWWRRRRTRRRDHRVPAVLVNHADSKGAAPFVDATGSRDGALLGDVRHDPYQSGGSETPSHMLLEPGAIHRAHGGVLYIDEISTLSMESQQALLTALQRRSMPITGRSPGSSGTMVRSQDAPCDCLIVLAGNPDDVRHIHPALRSRIRGYGYEIYTSSKMPINRANSNALASFIAWEVREDGRIPHFTKEAVRAVLLEAARRSEADGYYTLRLRELGGLVRAAGDLAMLEDKRARRVEGRHVERAVVHARSLEEQMEGHD